MNKIVVIACVAALLVVGAGAAVMGSGIMAPYKEETVALETLCSKRFPTRPDYCECLVGETRKVAGEHFPALVQAFEASGRFQESKDVSAALADKGDAKKALSRAVGQCITVWQSGSGIKFSQ